MNDIYCPECGSPRVIVYRDGSCECEDCRFQFYVNYRGELEIEKGIQFLLNSFYFGRDEATRTPDPYVPNVVRYQLRYIPIFFVQ